MAKELVLEPRLAVGAAGQVWGGLVEAAQFGMALVDFDARLMAVNAAFATLVGYTPAELVGLNLVDLCLEDERDTMVAALQAFRQGSRAVAKFRDGAVGARTDDVNVLLGV